MVLEMSFFMRMGSRIDDRNWRVMSLLALLCRKKGPRMLAVSRWRPVAVKSAPVMVMAEG